MPLSWNEIKSRALAFSNAWGDVDREQAEAKPFLIEFLNVFGINRKRVATFEHKVKKLNEADGYIDLLWKGVLLVEMKSKGKDLQKAYQQAKDYCFGLPQHELPKLILISDFNEFHLYDEDGTQSVFLLKDLYSHVSPFWLARRLPEAHIQRTGSCKYPCRRIDGKAARPIESSRLLRPSYLVE